jgi:hemerythrin-like domain-containing protein
MPKDNDLLSRAGLPADLRFLLERYPRETWQGHPNVGGMATFWLERHDMFRELGAMLTSGIGAYREGHMDARDFAGWFVPRLHFFLGHLDGHHRIEDEHYFPVFAKAERRLKRGFDLLDGDHHLIHDALAANAQSAQDFLAALEADEDRRRRAADAYAESNDKLVAMLARHLADEEDLIIPLILDRGDQALGGP